MKGRIVAASVVSAALALALAGCGSQQDASRAMTDEEIMAAIERGDDETFAKAREEAQAAIDDALAEFEALTDEEREALRESILSEVEARLANVGTTTVNRYVTEKAGDTYVTETHPTYVTEENTYMTQGEEVPPRIEDGMAIPVAWDVQREFVYEHGEYVTEPTLSSRSKREPTISPLTRLTRGVVMRIASRSRFRDPLNISTTHLPKWDRHPSLLPSTCPCRSISTPTTSLFPTCAPIRI